MMESRSSKMAGNAANWLALCVGALSLAACGSGNPQAPDSSPASEPATATAIAASDCPAGSTPEQPGDSTQERPALAYGAPPAAGDPTQPRIVVGEVGYVPAGAGTASLQSTWAFDVCNNRWDQLRAASPAGVARVTTLARLVTDPQTDQVLGLPVGLTPVWSFDPTTDAWSAATARGGGYEGWPTAGWDTTGGRLLAFDANLLSANATSSGVLAYDPAIHAWSPLPRADSATATPRIRMDHYDLAYDSGAGRLILLITPSQADEIGQTWAFDPVEGTWDRRADLPKTLAGGYPDDGWATAYDPVSRRTWLFADTAMLGYDATDDSWKVAERDDTWPTSQELGNKTVDPLARRMGTMVLDRANARLVVLGGQVRPLGDPVGGFACEASLLATDDIWAYDPVTNKWTLLLAPSESPTSSGPG
ncbi:MAG: hypothetical protein ACOYEV_04115 [Candidatus Nanopelagicales bacterium]